MIKGIVIASDDDEEHEKALRKTGFWGSKGAGALVLCENTKRFLLAYRSSEVQEPHTWGVWGGAIDSAEDVTTAVKRELKEETGYKGGVQLTPLLVYKTKGFQYHNFLAVVPKEFKPRLDWENEGYRWCEGLGWPTPLHFGLQAILQHKPSMALIQKALRSK